MSIASAFDRLVGNTPAADPPNLDELARRTAVVAAFFALPEGPGSLHPSGRVTPSLSAARMAYDENLRQSADDLGVPLALAFERFGRTSAWYLGVKPDGGQR